MPHNTLLWSLLNLGRFALLAAAVRTGARSSLRSLAARLCFAATWVELQQMMRFRAPSAIVADPMADWDGDPERHVDWLRSEPGVPLFLYTELTPPSAQALLALGPCGIRGLIFYGYGDTPKRLVDTLDAALSSSMGRQP